MIYTSHSSRNTFKACKRKYHWSYIEGLEQERKPKALRMGTAWGVGLEHGKDAISDFYGEVMMSAPDWEIDELAHELQILRALYDTYPFSRGGRAEVPFRHIGPNYEDRGQLDGLRFEAGMPIPRENKLYARFGNMEREKLEFDDQVSAYFAALVDGEVEDVPACDLNTMRMEYNVTLKPALRKKQGETDKAFTVRCVADIMARPDHYHHQVILTRSEEALEDFRQRRDKHAMDLIYEEKMGVWERNPAACFDYGQCPFLKICRSPHHEQVPEGYKQREERS